MGTELKMNKVFKSKLQPEHLRVKSTPVRESCDDSVKPHEVICHAVNNHDRLIEELEQLRKERDDLVLWLRGIQMECVEHDSPVVNTDVFINSRSVLTKIEVCK